MIESGKFSEISVIFLLFLVFSSPFMSGQESFNKSIKKNWFIQSSEKVTSPGMEISRAGFNCSSWFKTELPRTVMGALSENKVYSDIFVGRNLSKIPEGQFKKSWWYRTEFRLEKGKSEQKNCILEFDGINYRANIWLNGKLIADSNSVFGSFCRFSFDISDYADYDGL
ncbi:MAG: glycosyl hydrolase 2 galactose-binding domain-containing protein, partial [Syntrophothermus sp.]